ncbi:unnamed protein product [Allacma fusca]|uniref:Heat shock protein 70 n=1 Tax=Allacma fusca TaxID=39272 RepID=A0A8J2KC83_9HEXA|nr:unnamed protein product [Allacma fusca]
MLFYLKETADDYLGDPLISEPAAAAVAYGLHLNIESERRTCLIFDLGGGTFDVAIAEFHKKKMKIMAIDGDAYLGGEDFDNSMMQYCVDVFEREHGVDLLRVGGKAERSRRKQRIKMECENQKRALTFRPDVKVSIDAIYKENSLTVGFSRDTFSELIKPHLDKCMKIVDQILANCQMKETHINDIMIVGGSSRIPYVQSRLSEKFGGRSLLKRIAPELAVAHGAALVAYHSENPELLNVAIQDLIMRPGPE